MTINVSIKQLNDGGGIEVTFTGTMHDGISPVV